MRITNNIILRNFKTNLNKNLEKVSKYQKQLATGKEISKPSDSPALISRVMELRTSLNENNQYKRNIEDSLSWLNVTDSALGNINDVLHRTRELTVYGATGTLSDSDRNSLKMEVQQMVDEFISTSNSKYDGRYIFGGRENSTPPFEMVTDILGFKGDNGLNKVEVTENNTIGINITGDRLLDASGENIGDIFNKVIDGLSTGDSNKLNEALGEMDTYMEGFLSLRAEVGSKINSLESTLEQNEKQSLDMTDMLSEIEDIDYAQKIMEFKNMENMYQASLSTGARVIQPTLLDFLR